MSETDRKHDRKCTLQDVDSALLTAKPTTLPPPPMDDDDEYILQYKRLESAVRRYWPQATGESPKERQVRKLAGLLWGPVCVMLEDARQSTFEMLKG